MKKTLLPLLCLTAACMTVNADEYISFSDKTDIDDLALIYIGSQHRPDWDKELLRPYVTHTYEDGKQSWMFDGFLMIEFQAWNKIGQVVSFGESGAFGAAKEDWERLITEQLGVEKNVGCKALDDLIGELIPVLGEPGHKHKVVFTLPLAEAKSASSWGEVNGKQLNFLELEDRETAMKWYIDLVIKLWNEANFKNIELDGVYWTKESLYYYVDKQLVKDMNDYYHSKGLKSYWIPYFTAAGREEWSTLDIDVAYLQPNYYFNTETPMSQLDSSIDQAWEKKYSGLEVEFGGYGTNYTWSENGGNRWVYTCKDTGLYGISPTYYQRFVDYIDRFESELIFETFPVAYYSGSMGVSDFTNSTNAKDNEIMHRLARILNRRHVLTGWDKEPSTAGINETIATDAPIAHCAGQTVTLSAGTNLYTIDGRLIAKASDQSATSITCRPGVYIASNKTSSQRIAVR